MAQLKSATATQSRTHKPIKAAHGGVRGGFRLSDKELFMQMPSVGTCGWCRYAIWLPLPLQTCEAEFADNAHAMRLVHHAT